MSEAKLKEAIEQYERCNKDIKELENIKRIIMEKVLPLICPHKPGDTIDIEGYAWRCKKGKVLKVYAVWNNEKQNFTWGATCLVIKKDGTESKKITSFVKNPWGNE